MNDVTFLLPDEPEDYFIIPDCPLPRPGDVIEHTDTDPAKDGLWLVVDRPYQFRTYSVGHSRLATVFVHVERTDQLP